MTLPLEDYNHHFPKSTKVSSHDSISSSLGFHHLNLFQVWMSVLEHNSSNIASSSDIVLFFFLFFFLYLLESKESVISLTYTPHIIVRKDRLTARDTPVQKAGH